MAHDYTKTDRILLFSLWSLAFPYPDSVTLYLEIAPGDNDTRQKLLTMVRNNQDIFKIDPESTEDTTLIYKRSLLTSDFYENTTNGQREQEIRRQWNEFLERDLPRIEAALKKERWIWKSVGSRR